MNFGVWPKLAVFLSLIGFSLSFFSVTTSILKKQDPEYKALCDISEHMSCSKVFTSKFGKGFGLIGMVAGEDSVFVQSNGVYGMLMYFIIIVINCISVHVSFFTKFEFLLVSLSNVGSIYLSYILYFILEDFCIICVSCYVINFLLLIVSYKKQRKLAAMYNRISLSSYFANLDSLRKRGKTL